MLVQLRKHQSPAVQITVGELTLEPALHRITVCGKEPSLTAREYRILELLMKNPTKIFSKQEIYESAWDSYYMGGGQDHQRAYQQHPAEAAPVYGAGVY